MSYLVLIIPLPGDQAPLGQKASNKLLHLDPQPVARSVPSPWPAYLPLIWQQMLLLLGEKLTGVSCPPRFHAVLTGDVCKQDQHSATTGSSLPSQRNGRLASGSSDLVEELTPRESDVLELLGQGLTNREIGQRLFISEKTVKSHMSEILAKLNVSHRTEAVVAALRYGILAPAHPVA